MDIFFNDYTTEYGTLRVGRLADAVCFCYFTHGPDSASQVAKAAGARLCRGSSPLLDRAAAESVEFLAGERRELDYPVALIGSDFRKRVWTELMKVGYGQTLSYGELAGRIGCPKGVRAVGGAVGANPLFAIVPCHRVVAAHGLGGFGWGVNLKLRLLQMESSLGSLCFFD